MWEYRSPNIQCFLAPVKPRARQLQSTSTTLQSGEVFVGKSGNIETHHESPTNTSFSETPKHDDEMSLCIASPKEPIFPETIPEEASSIEEEHVYLFPSSQGPDPIFYTADASLLQQSHFQSSRRSSRSSLQSRDRFHDKHTTKFDFDKIEAFERKHDESGKPKGSSSTERESVDTDMKSPQYQKGEDQKGFTHHRYCSTVIYQNIFLNQNSFFCSSYDIAAATFLDVAVLRCLFVSHWQEEGIYWSLHYLYNR